MEYIIMALALLGFVLVIFAFEYMSRRKAEKEFEKSLYKNYGVVREKTYSPERQVHIPAYYEKHKEENSIDDITWDDLSMDDVFKRADFTLSAAGEEYLYYKLRTPKQSAEELAHFEELTGYFAANEDDRVRVQLLLHRLGYTGNYSLYNYIDQLDILGERKNLKQTLIDLLFIPVIGLCFVKLSVGLFALAVLLCCNIITYFQDKKAIEPYLVSFYYIERLIEICEELVKCKFPVCEEDFTAMKELLKHLRPLRRKAAWMNTHGMNLGGNPLDMFMDYLKMTTHFDLMQFNSMLKDVRSNIAGIDELITCVGLYDTAIATGALRKSMTDGWCVPEFTGEDSLKMEEGYHLFLTDPVKNSIEAPKGVLLTGSNASGKSTFLKTVALNAVMAQTLHTCAAAAYRAPFYNIYSSMSLRDSISTGESYFIVEIKAIKRILAARNSERRVLCFVDEVLRGTNTVERIAAAVQILKSLAGEHFLTFAATHDIELTELLKDDYDNYHFTETILNGDVSFSYKLLTGKADSRNAIKLLQIMGYDEKVVRNAEDMAQRFLAEGVWE